MDIFISGYDYFDLDKFYGMKIEDFVKAPIDVQKKKDRYMGTNFLLWDLGVDDVLDDVAVDSKILEMDQVFHLVMILEHFEVCLRKNIIIISL